MTGLFDEGAGDLDSDAFQTGSTMPAPRCASTRGRDAIYGSMRMLAEQKDEAFDLLRLAVEQPRFDQRRSTASARQIVSGIIAGARDPDTAAQIEWSKAVYGDHPYSRAATRARRKTLATITADDLKACTRRCSRATICIVGVVGAIDAETLKKELDHAVRRLAGKAGADAGGR